MRQADLYRAGTRLIAEQQPGPRELAGDFLDLRAVGRSLHGLAALHRGRLGFIGLTAGHDLAVGCLEPEPEFACAVFVDLEQQLS